MLVVGEENLIKLTNEGQHQLTRPYRRVFEELTDSRRYVTFSVAEFYVDRERRVDPNRVNVVVRIDVDSCLHLEPALARILNSYGIRSSHYFLTFEDRYYKLWGTGVPREVLEQGHEVGVHSDHYYEELTRGIDGLERLRLDVKKLGNEIGEPIRGMCFHGHQGIMRLGKSNWQLTNDVPPQQIGVEYHDGRTSCYLERGAASWKPNADVQISDFMGVSGHWGWNHSPSMPLRLLRSAKCGDVVHMTFHTKNAFRYWKDWSEKYDECPIERPAIGKFLHTTTLIILRRYRLTPQQLKARGFNIVKIALERLPMLMAKVTMTTIGRIWPKSSEADPDTTWENARERIYARGIDYWRGHLDRLKLTEPCSNVLEIGSGNGQWLLAFSESADYVLGIEPEERFLEFSAKKIGEFPDRAPQIGLAAGIAEKLPVTSSTFDMVLCAGVLMFTKQEKAIQEISRVLRPGGRVAVMMNGPGYFAFYLLNGLRHRNENKLIYGYKGLVNTCVRSVTGRQFTPCAGWKGEMRRLFARNNLTMEEVKVWRAQDILPYKCLGLPTNYAFLGRKVG